MTNTIQLFFAVSLDGYIADPNGGVDFLDEVPDEVEVADSNAEPDEDDYDSFIAQIDTIVMGRETYAFLEGHGSWPYGNRKTFIVTHRVIPNPLCTLETREVSDYAVFANELRQTTTNSIWIVGGGQVMRGFLNAGEVDRVHVSIMPVTIGSGIPMFANDGMSLRHFTLESVSQQSNGVVNLRYSANRRLD